MARHSWYPPIRRVAFAGALGLAVGQAGPSRASSLSVAPIRIDLAPRSPSALLVVSNAEDREVWIEAGVSSWRETPEGEAVLLPTRELIAFPLVFSIAPHGTRSIRIGLASRAPVLVEKCFRVVVAEMPASKSAATSGRVDFTTRFSVPVFVSPSRPTPAVALEDAHVEGGGLRFRVVNGGNAHALLKDVVVVGSDASGEESFRSETKGWYLLAGGVRTYVLPLGREQCLASRSFRVETRSAESGPVSLRFEGSGLACAK